ncbi:MAG TPA: patatin-like phospholipase family protein, partial [Pyrinomonadaceae bacterium]|nr:patatin-like phospholipase family protein [Pyrinomonadaceae bacterium]
MPVFNSEDESTSPDLPLPLFKVLIDEYNHQQIGPAYPPPSADKKTEEILREKIKSYNDVLKDNALKDEEKREKRKRINSEEVKAFYAWLYLNKVRRSALCFSGGGIRSATFGLGILQGLARKGLLKRFDFLSTVSGGGYLGSWLSAWIHRKGLDKVEQRLKNERPPSPLEPEPDAISHLRTYSNYMSPKVGLLSADTWTLVAIFLRNLILNWLVLIPLILLALMIPRLCIVAIKATPEDRLVKLVPHAGWFRSFWLAPHAGLPVWLKNPLLWLAPNAPTGGSGAFWIAVILGIISIAYIYVNRPSLADSKLRDEARPGSVFWNKLKTQGWFLILCMAPLLLLAVLITTYYAWLGRDLGDVTFPNFGNLISNRSVVKLFYGTWVAGKLGIDASTPSQPWFVFICFGLILNLGGLIFSFPWRRDRSFWRIVSEIVIALSAGGLGGLLTWLIADKIFTNPTASPLWVASYVCFASPTFLILFLLAATVFVGASSRFTSDPDREWLARAGAWIIIASVAWSLISVIVIFGPMLLVYGIKTAIASASLGALSGIFTLLLGYSGKTSVKGKQSSGASDIILMIAAPVFAVFILICLSLGTSWLIVELGNGVGSTSDLTDPYLLLAIVYNSPLLLLLILSAAFLAIGLLASRFVNINKFSLHASYRDRLIRAYLGASRIEEEREPNPFTGLDENDNLQMQQLRTQLFHDGNIKTIQQGGTEISALTLLAEKLKQAYESKKGGRVTKTDAILADDNRDEAKVSAYLWEHLSEGTQHFIKG